MQQDLPPAAAATLCCPAASHRFICHVAAASLRNSEYHTSVQAMELNFPGIKGFRQDSFGGDGFTHAALARQARQAVQCTKVFVGKLVGRLGPGVSTQRFPTAGLGPHQCMAGEPMSKWNCSAATGVGARLSLRLDQVGKKCSLG